MRTSRKRNSDSKTLGITLIKKTINPDLDSREHLDQFIQAFYAKVLVDPILAPIFLDIADVELDVHLPHIRNYWAKLLLKDTSYQRHTMNIHRELHSKHALREKDFKQWLALFTETIDEMYIGENADRAKKVAASIASNMQQTLPD